MESIIYKEPLDPHKIARPNPTTIALYEEFDVPILHEYFVHNQSTAVHFVVKLNGHDQIIIMVNALPSEHLPTTRVPVRLCVGQVAVEASGGGSGYEPYPLPGAAFSPQAIPITGSLGFYFVDKDGQVYVMTAGHNIAIGDPSKNTAVEVDILNQQIGVGGVVIQPPLVRIRDQIEHLGTEIKTYDEMLSSLEKPEREKRMVRKYKESDEQELATLLSLHLGTAIEYATISSVYELAAEGGFYYDYALLKVLPSRVGVNQVAGHPIVSITNITSAEDKLVTKRGATTDLTYGRLMTVPSRLEGHPRFPGECLRARAIVGTEGPFCRKGDSGGPIVCDKIQALGFVLGLGEVEEDGRHITVTFFAELEDVLCRIREKHGLSLELLM